MNPPTRQPGSRSAGLEGDPDDVRARMMCLQPRIIAVPWGKAGRRFNIIHDSSKWPVLTNIMVSSSTNGKCVDK